MAEIPRRAASAHSLLLRQKHDELARRFHASLISVAQRRREFFDVQTMAAWALRMSPTGWAVVREGRLGFTNRAFDVLDRGALIGPGWLPVPLDGGPEPPLIQTRSLRELAVAEAQLLFESDGPHRQSHFTRSDQVVEITVERPVHNAGLNLGLVLVRDVTKQVAFEGEIAAMRARLMETERTRVAAELAVGVAHDLGNLVGALRARVSSLALEQANDPATRALQAIVEAQSALVQKLQSVAHPRFETPVRLRLLSEVIQPAIQMVETSLRMGSLAGAGRVSIQVDPSVSAELTVLAPRDELINVVINLFFNARDAMPDGGTLVVAAAVLSGRVVLRVLDDGTGIPAQNLERIFEPLFTTKGRRGMGLGLSTAAALMRRLGGTIVACNRAQGGACIELAFADPDEDAAPKRP